MPGILDLLSGPVTALVNGAKSLISQKLTNDADKAAANAAIDQLQIELQRAVLEADSKLAEAQRDVIVAEAKSESWLARNWRPILMLVFTFIVFNNFVLSPILSIPKTDIPENMWELLKIGVGGYISGRSVEKAVALWRANGK